MGTRSLTYFYDRRFNKEANDAIACFYRQMDGYPECHGKALAEFLAGMTVVNGYGGKQEAPTHANGAGCLAAQTVAHFKNDSGIGGIYLRRPEEDKDSGQEYEYRVYVDDEAIPQITITVKSMYDDGKDIFNGSPADMLVWIDNRKDNDDDA